MASEPRVSVAVMAHRKREAFVGELVEALDRPAEVVWDRHNDRWDTGRRSLLAYDPDATHHLVIQDDAVPCRDLVAGIERALAAVPAPAGAPTPLGLYVGKITPYPHQVAALAADADAGDVSWLTIGRVLWGVAVVIPTELIDDMVAWGDGRGSYIRNYDARIGRWLELRKITTWFPWPSLVDHRDSPSLIEGHDAPGRHAFRFLGRDRSALEVDWGGDVIHVPALARYGPVKPVKPRYRRRPKEDANMPAPVVSGDVMIAKKDAIVQTATGRRKIRRGETTAAADSWIVLAKPHLWENLGIDFPGGEEEDEAGPIPVPVETAEAVVNAGETVVPSEPAAKDVRAWAKDQGLEVPTRGPLPDTIVAAFKAAAAEE